MQADVTRRRMLGGALALAAGSTSVAAPQDWLPQGLRQPASYLVASGGSVLTGVNEELRRQPASLAKLAAVLVTLDAVRAEPQRLSAGLRVSAAAASVEGTRLGLRAGDRPTLAQLLTAMLVGSANDACLAVAEHIGGSGPAFVDRMNRLAAEISMRDTHFLDPCGLDRPGQHTTASDLLKLARRALAEPLIQQEAARDTVRIALPTGGRSLAMRGTNALLGNYEGAFGLKTGYTRQAGPCLIGAARRGDVEVVVVVLGAADRWPVSVALLDEAFDRLTGFPRVRSRATVGGPDI